MKVEVTAKKLVVIENVQVTIGIEQIANISNLYITIKEKNIESLFDSDGLKAIQELASKLDEALQNVDTEGECHD